MLEFIANRTSDSTRNRQIASVGTTIRLAVSRIHLVGSKCYYLYNYLAIYIFSGWQQSLQTDTNENSLSPLLRCLLHALIPSFPFYFQFINSKQ